MFLLWTIGDNPYSADFLLFNRPALKIGHWALGMRILIFIVPCERSSWSLLQSIAFCTLVVKGKRENTKPFPLSLSPFPDFCKNVQCPVLLLNS
jgi:hypothetical protein